MKRVGVIVRKNIFNNIEYYAIKKDVIDYLNKKVIVIPIILNNYNNVLELVKLCDGIILTGGDILCKLDYKLIDYIYKNNIPCLGICLGMQLMGLYKNGTLGKIKNHHNTYHKIKINKKSTLLKILGRGNIKVNSRHYDYLIKTDLNVGAISDDGIIEEVEDKYKRFFIGVQWHPESLKSRDSNKLINYFIKTL